MEKVYHYTSKKNWKKTQKTKILLPKSEGFHFEYVPERVIRILGSTIGVYLTALKNPQDRGWIQTGLMPLLTEHTKGEVLLEIPVIEKEKAFVRDHSLNSPEAFLKEYGTDLYTIIHNNSHRYRNEPTKQHQFSEREDETIIRLRQRYLNSTILLKDYNGSYKAPELWLPQKTPLELITEMPILITQITA